MEQMQAAIEPTRPQLKSELLKLVLLRLMVHLSPMLPQQRNQLWTSSFLFCSSWQPSMPLFQLLLFPFPPSLHLS